MAILVMNISDFTNKDVLLTQKLPDKIYEKDD